MKFNVSRTVLGSAALTASVFFCIAALWPVHSAKCDEFNCDGNLCDRAHACNRGCKCVYPTGASMGHCEVWYKK
jgi:hypothetical protein